MILVVPFILVLVPSPVSLISSTAAMVMSSFPLAAVTAAGVFAAPAANPEPPEEVESVSVKRRIFGAQVSMSLGLRN